MDELKCLTDEWIKKMGHMYTMEYWAALRNKEILTDATIWMNLENIILSKRSQSQKGQTLYRSTHMKYLKQSNHSNEKGNCDHQGLGRRGRGS